MVQAYEMKVVPIWFETPKNNTRFDDRLSTTSRIFREHCGVRIVRDGEGLECRFPQHVLSIRGHVSKAQTIVLDVIRVSGHEKLKVNVPQGAKNIDVAGEIANVISQAYPSAEVHHGDCGVVCKDSMVAVRFNTVDEARIVVNQQVDSLLEICAFDMALRDNKLSGQEALALGIWTSRYIIRSLQVRVIIVCGVNLEILGPGWDLAVAIPPDVGKEIQVLAACVIGTKNALLGAKNYHLLAHELAHILLDRVDHECGELNYNVLASPQAKCETPGCVEVTTRQSAVIRERGPRTGVVIETGEAVEITTYERVCSGAQRDYSRRAAPSQPSWQRSRRLSELMSRMDGLSTTSRAETLLSEVARGFSATFLRGDVPDPYGADDPVTQWAVREWRQLSYGLVDKRSQEMECKMLAEYLRALHQNGAG